MKQNVFRGSLYSQTKSRVNEGGGQKRATKVRERKERKGLGWSPPLWGPGTGAEDVTSVK